MRLSFKFNLLVLPAVGLALVAALVANWRVSEQRARDQMVAEAAVIMRGADAVGHYTNAEIAPLLANQMNLQFLPQAAPFFASRRIEERVCAGIPDCAGFREAAPNPTNPADRALPWEAGITARFRADPLLQTSVTERRTDQGLVLSYAEPIYVQDASCLSCHSTPSVAPSSMVDVYGSSNGFGWKQGDLVAVNIVSISERPLLEKAQRDNRTAMALGTGVVFALAVVLNLALHFLVLVPIRKVAAVATEVSLGKMDAPEVELTSRDEIGSLSTCFNRMRRSLAAAMKILEG